MKKAIIPISAIVIAIYTILRNNIYNFDSQIVWSTHPDIFYKVIIQSLLLISAIWALYKQNKNKYLVPVISLVGIDFLGRLSQNINHYHSQFLYSHQPENIPLDSVVVIHKLWPAQLLGIIELCLLLFYYNYIVKNEKRA